MDSPTNLHVAPRPAADAPLVVSVRPIEPADAPALERLYAGLSPESRRLRFLSLGTRFGESDARYFCGPDHEHREGYVAEARDPDGATSLAGHFCLEPCGPGEVEIAVAVADRFQGRGIGSRLVDEAARWAEHHGTERFRAWFAADNVGIRRLLARLGRPFRYGSGLGGTVDVTIDLQPVTATSRRAA